MDDAVQKKVSPFKTSDEKKCINGSHMSGVFEILQSLRKSKVLCDIELKTDDGTIVFAHKVVLVSASPYFHELFTNLDECNKNLVNITELDSTVLQLLINYIYTGEIFFNKKNVKVLIAAANHLQLGYVKSVCAEFLQSQMDPSNCLGFKAFANLHDCTELLTSSEEYIKKQFLEVVKYDEFLSLSSVEVIKLISCDEIAAPFEEKVSFTEMDAIQNQVSTFKTSDQKKCMNGSHMVGVFEFLQSLRKDTLLCDVQLRTDDGTIVFAHKVLLVSACPYFHKMFTNLDECNKNLVNITELDSNVLQLLINYIYTGEILVTKKKCKAAANHLQLAYVKSVRAEFLQSQMDPSNCLGIKAFANLHDCMELLRSSEEYVKKQFLEVVKYEEFLSLSSDEVIKLISCDEIVVPIEEKVYECVMNWVKHELGFRKDFLPEVMEHVRLSLTSKQYILEKVVDEPLLKSNPKCNNYVKEALHFHLLKSVNPFTNLQTIWKKPRQSGDLRKVILVLGKSESTNNFSINWYDPATNIFQRALDIRKGWLPVRLALIVNQFVFGVGSYTTNSQSVKMLDLYSQTSSLLPVDDMSVGRIGLGVGVLNNCVGGYDDNNYSLNSAEVFDVSSQEWRAVASMSSMRSYVGVGVLNSLLYAVGGYDSSSKQRLKSVECYDPSIDSWKLVAELCVCRSRVGVLVLEGVMYAIGGWDGSVVHKSVEVYTESSKVWTNITDMHFCRKSPTVVALDRSLYVMGGADNDSTNLDSIEIYNPKTNTWKLVESSLNCAGLVEIIAGVVIDRPSHFKTN